MSALQRRHTLRSAEQESAVRVNGFITVDEGFSFDDWFGRFDTHVYRFDLSD